MLVCFVLTILAALRRVHAPLQPALALAQAIATVINIPVPRPCTMSSINAQSAATPVLAYLAQMAAFALEPVAQLVATALQNTTERAVAVVTNRGFK